MPFKFYIQDLYDRTEVTEPRGWDGIISVLERDFDVHGVFFKYTDGSVKLGFSCESKTLLEAAYQADGSEAYFLFEADEADNDLSTFTTIFSSELDFSTRNFDEDYFDIDVNEINEIDNIKNRGGLKINLNKGLSLDGIDLANVNYDNSIYSLATKNFKQLIVKNTGETLDTVQSTAATTTSYLYANFGFNTIESEELKKYRQKSTVLNTSVITGDLLTLEEAGALDMNFDYDFDLNLTEDQGSGTTTYFATLSIKFDPPVNGVLDEIALDTENSGGSASPFDTTLTFLGDIDDTISAEAGTKIWLELEIQQTSTGTTQMTCELDITKFDVTITDKIGILGTQAQWYHLHDALNKNLNFITNEYDYLYSELLGDLERGYSLDGCLSGMRFTNGFRARQINDTDKAPIFSFKNYISNLNTIAAVGYGIEELSSPVGIGFLTIGTHEITVYDELRIDVDGDITSYFGIGDEIGFFDNEFLYGSWPVTSISYDGGPDETEVIFDVTGNESLQEIGIISTVAYVTTSRNPVFRDRLRVEKWEHFYGNSELIDLGVVQEYSEEPFDGILYNELNIKFSKFSNDEEKATTLEEIHTESGWVLPLTKSKQSLSLVLQWIGSTFLFNESRERIFSKKPTTSHILDDSIFFCDKAEKEGVYTVTFHISTDIISMPADAYENVVNGSDFFSIADAVDVGNDGTHEIDNTKQIVFDITNNEYDVPVLSTLASESNDEVTIIHVADTQKLFKPEANDLLSSSSGITRPTYIMNQRRTMKRFLIRWGRYVSSVLAYLVDSANVTVQNLFFINNGDFSSELDTSQLTSDCLMGDSSGALIREADNINSLALGTAKFKPNFINGTVHICDTDFDRIKGAHKNRLDNFAIMTQLTLCSSPIRNDIAFIHQTGIFDITIICAFDNIASTTKLDNLLWNLGSGSDHGFSILFTNSFTSIEGLIYFSIGIPASSVTSAISVDIRSYINDGKRHTLRFVGNGTIVGFTIDNQSIEMTTPEVTSGGSTNPSRDLYIGASTIGSDNHIGLYETLIIKNGDGDEIVKFNLTERQGNNIENEGDSAPVSTNASYAVLPSFSDDLNYGYLTVTSPNDKTVSGWLMEIKRNPVDRIAKVKLLESTFVRVGDFDGILYCQSNAAKTDTDFIHQTGIFNIIIRASFLNGSSTTQVSTLFATIKAGDNDTGAKSTYSNSVVGFEGKINFILTISGSSETLSSSDLSSILEDGNLHTIQWVGNGSDVTLFVDGINKTLDSTSITPGGGTSDEKLLVGGDGKNNTGHVGYIAFIKIINNSSEQIINYTFSDGNNLIIPNSGEEEVLNSDLVWIGTGKYANIVDI